MALGKAVISTTIGAEGIDYTVGKNILIADDATSFVNEIKKLHNNIEFCNNIGENARTLIFEEHNNSKLIDEMIEFYRSIL